MGNRRGTDDHFSKRVRTEREQREWTQSEMAKMLSDKGIRMHWTTIAKIEKGDRLVRIDEAAAIADLFETSVDVLLGRTTNGGTDAVANELRLARHSATSAQLTFQELQRSLADTAVALFSVSTRGDSAVIAHACREAAAAAGAADQALATALAQAGGLAQ